MPLVNMYISPDVVNVDLYCGSFEATNTGSME